ncbi:MAG: hypothetical protein KAS76_02700 [Thermoplasmatales archaeon]|nr:hypothetical protein [Thermoplasmatales archaeon]MCK4995868.1 hypothetical protein [Thermoplasmatales archaeon]
MKGLIRKVLEFAEILMFIVIAFLRYISGILHLKRHFGNLFRKKSLLLSRYILGENDEGLHENSKFIMQEWWYYNVHFDDEVSELKNWSILASFSKYLKKSSLKLGLNEEVNKGYNTLNIQTEDCFQYFGPAVNLSFNKTSYAKGKYPNWHIYAESKMSEDLNISADLKFKANSLPMWMLKNTGRNRSNSFFGYYCVMNCDAEGTVTLNGKSYNVKGRGYHDHTWAPVGIKKAGKKVKEVKEISEKNKSVDIFEYWDWFVIHFENGWDMFIGKLYLGKPNSFSKFMPGILCFTPDGSKLYECYFYILDHVENIDSSVPGTKIPSKIHIKALILNTFGAKQFKGPLILDFCYELNNKQETIVGVPPAFGIFQSQGRTYGVAKSMGKTVKLDGWAIVETASTF